MLIKNLLADTVKAIGYAVYFNVYYNKFVKNSQLFIVPVLMKTQVISPQHIDKHLIQEIIELTSQSLINRIKDIPQVAAHPGAWEAIVTAGRLAYAESYKYVYYASVGTFFILLRPYSIS